MPENRQSRKTVVRLSNPKTAKTGVPNDAPPPPPPKGKGEIQVQGGVFVAKSGTARKEADVTGTIEVGVAVSAKEPQNIELTLGSGPSN